MRPDSQRSEMVNEGKVLKNVFTLFYYFILNDLEKRGWNGFNYLN